MRPFWPASVLAVAAMALHAAQSPNVLFIVVDDLRPQLGCYGDPVAKSPNLDRLAKRSLRFDHAYVQRAVCSPSRNSFLSGLRPATTGLRGFGTKLRDKVPDVVTLPEHFKRHGYTAAGIGKVFHFYVETGLDSEDDPQSWSRPVRLPRLPVWGPQQERMRQRLIAGAKARGTEFKHSHDLPRANAWDAPDVPDHALQDGEIADGAVALLGELKNGPFFLAVGFIKPHLPFVAPKKYWDLYSAGDLQLPDNQDPPKDAPPYVVPTWPDLRKYANIPQAGPLSEDTKRHLLHGYLACVSYVDAQIGRVLDALDALELRDRTMVVVLGDHGMQLGEHGSWTDKHSNFETSTRTPLLVSAPGLKANGRSTGALVELVDLYPTLAELCGLPAPARCDGRSFKPLLDQPDRPWKTGAFSEMNRGGRLGRSVRTARWRFTEWKGRPGVDYELYDHRTDPGENVNLANLPEHAATVKELRALLPAAQ